VIDPALEARQVERTRALRERRDEARANEAVGALEAAAAGTENVLPRIRTAVEADVTLGEISHALRRVWGEHRP
jgi:methylmalonyl-CoA mutase N-terminal domain/subunit